MKQEFKSRFRNIKIVLKGYVEPNNGRVLHIADLYIDGELKNNEYFGNWNRLDENLSNYEMDSVNGDFVYIPVESGGFLINTLTLKKIILPYKGLSTVTFLKNEFIDRSLILIHSDEIIKINLDSFNVERVERKSKL